MRYVPCIGLIILPFAKDRQTSNTHRDYSHASGPHTYAHAPCTPHIPFRTALAVPPSTQASDRFLTATNRVHELAATAASAARTDTQASRHAGRPRRTTHSTPANNLHDRSSRVVSVCNVHLPLWGSRLARRTTATTTRTTWTRLIGYSNNSTAAGSSKQGGVV